jgi:hypothetical protein
MGSIYRTGFRFSLATPFTAWFWSALSTEGVYALLVAKADRLKSFSKSVKNGQKRPITLTDTASYIFHTPPEKRVKNVSQNFCAKIADLRRTGKCKPSILNNFPVPTHLGTSLGQE